MGEQPSQRSTQATPESPPEQQNTAGLHALEIMHEIRNPLEALSNLIYLADSDADNPEHVHSYMGMAEEQIRTLTRIANETLAFARGGQLPSPVVFSELIEAALRIHHRAITAKEIRVVQALPNSLCVDVRGGQMLQVLSNLFKNAIEAMPRCGTLSLRLQLRSKRIVLTVADNGSGILQRDLDKIFDPFFTTKGDTGTGLGLSLSKKIIEEHHGTLRVRSRVGSRGGTVFRISLPATDSGA